MIILNIRGGLGNQMFQFAYAYVLSKKNNDRIFISTFYQKREPLNRGNRLAELACNQQISCLPLILDDLVSVYYKIKKEILLKINSNKEQNMFYYLAEHGLFTAKSIYTFLGYPSSGKRIKYVDGYFQSIKYIEPYREEIKKQLTPCKHEFSLQYLNNQKKIILDNSVCVHIRRGDYTSDMWSKSLLICDEEYYVKAMRYIANSIKNPVFFIFSNSHEDIEWIKNNYRLEQSFNVNFIDFNESDIDDFILMSSCKHFILSNSSFSWWVQFFSENEEKIVVAPSKWTNENQDFSDVYDEGWIKIYV